MSTLRRTISQKSGLVHDVHEYSINWDTRELYLHAYLGRDESEEVDERMAQQLIKNLTFLSYLNTNRDPIVIHMMTCGGDWNYGMAIYDAIEACRCPVSILAYGHARSMSSIILQSADYRVLMPNVEFLIHFGTYGNEGNWTSMESEHEQYQKAQSLMLDIYTEKAKNGQFFINKKWSFKRIKKYFDDTMKTKQEWYMTPREAIEYGLADAILGDEGYENIGALLKAEE